MHNGGVVGRNWDTFSVVHSSFKQLQHSPVRLLDRTSRDRTDIPGQGVGLDSIIRLRLIDQREGAVIKGLSTRCAQVLPTIW